jgi:hypothetical protein
MHRIQNGDVTILVVFIDTANTKKQIVRSSHGSDSCQSRIMQTQGQSQTSPHGIFGGQRGTGTGFWVFRVSIITPLFHMNSCIYHQHNTLAINSVIK